MIILGTVRERMNSLWYDHIEMARTTQKARAQGVEPRYMSLQFATSRNEVAEYYNVELIGEDFSWEKWLASVGKNRNIPWEKAKGEHDHWMYAIV